MYTLDRQIHVYTYIVHLYICMYVRKITIKKQCKLLTVYKYSSVEEMNVCVSHTQTKFYNCIFLKRNKLKNLIYMTRFIFNF